MYNENDNNRYYMENQQPQSQLQTQTPYQNVQPPEIKKKRSGLWAKIVAVCLACVIVGGAAGAGVTAIIGKDSGKAPVSISFTDKTKDSTQSGVNLGASALTSSAVSSAYTGKTLSAEEIYALGSQSVVGISTEILTSSYNIFGQLTSAAVSGSGFVISEDGYVMTNYHVIEDANSAIEVKLQNGESYEAKVVGYEAENDIAVLKIDATGLVPVVIGSSANLNVGETVYAIGNPLGELTYTMTSGIVSALDREISTDDNVSINMFQIDAAINSGNSGGPVFNARGEVIGVVTAKYADTGVEGLGFAIPVDDAVGIAKELIDHGYVTGKPYFGVEVRTVTESIASYYNMVPGAYVQTVNSGSCAEKAGIQVGDIITKLGDTDVISSAELSAAKKDYKAGETAEVTVYRSGQYLTLKVTFDEQVPTTAAAADENTQTQQPNSGSQQFPDGYGSYGWNPYGSYGWNPYGNSSYAG